MDALQILRDDHRRIKDVFRRFDEAADNRTRKAVADAAINELLNHTRVEEEIFYPAMRRLGMTDLVEEAEAEHHAANQAIQELSGLNANDGQLEAKFRVLVELVTEHITEEESQMFPRAAEAGFQRLERIGEEVEQMKRQLETATPSRSRSTARATRQRNSPTGSSGTRSRRSTTAGKTLSRSGATNGRSRLDTMTREQLYERAQKAAIPGRSQMNKKQLAQALGKGR